VEVSGKLHAPAALLPGSWVGPTAGLDYVDKRIFLPLLGHELQPLSHPIRSQSLYRLRYAGFRKHNTEESRGTFIRQR
jgi:hypothetical protein